MSGTAIQSFLSRPVIKVQIRTMPRGSWRWQNACRIQIVRCPRNEHPDLRRRGHTLVAIHARKLAVGTRDTLASITRAEQYASTLNA